LIESRGEIMTAIVGHKIKLDRHIDRERPCCRNICVISPGKGPHAAELRCADCDQHRGWLNKLAISLLEQGIELGLPLS
jgi:hypothetical protein